MKNVSPNLCFSQKKFQRSPPTVPKNGVKIDQIQYKMAHMSRDQFISILQSIDL